MRDWLQVHWFPSRKAQSQFEAIMEMAHRIADRHPPALLDLTRLLGRAIQSERIAQRVLQRRQHPPLPDLSFDRVFFDRSFPLTADGQGFWALTEIQEEERVIELARDVVLPWPWQRGRLVSALCSIGTGKCAGAWEQDALNHKIDWWLPQGIGWVEGGNHSLSAGIVQAEGIVRVHQVRLIHRVYDHVTCDGISFWRTHDHEKIGRVSIAEFAGLFEIGRLMLHYEVSA
jgi:hypothetical protein